MKSHLAWSLRKWDIRSLLSLRTVGFLEALRAGGHGKGGGLDIEGEARPPLAARCQSKLGAGELSGPVKGSAERCPGHPARPSGVRVAPAVPWLGQTCSGKHSKCLPSG